MKKVNLQDEFINRLHQKIPHRPELVKTVSSILDVEKEPVSRRLNGNVQFSINEMGILSKELGISIDSLLNKEPYMQWIPFLLEMPMGEKSINTLINLIQGSLDKKELLGHQKEFGYVFDTLPLEYFIPYPTLAKFMFFKWGHVFLGTHEFNNFSKWTVPHNLLRISESYMKSAHAVDKVIYIWDDSLIWDLVRDIEYFKTIHVIDEENMEILREELHAMLTKLELFIKGIRAETEEGIEMLFYISGVHLGLHCWYLISDTSQMAFFKTNFSHSPIVENEEFCRAVKEWLTSLQSISTLISGSGLKERRVFFERQHRIIDVLLT